jgi:hypothetical protein
MGGPWRAMVRTARGVDVQAETPLLGQDGVVSGGDDAAAPTPAVVRPSLSGRRAPVIATIAVFHAPLVALIGGSLSAKWAPR